MSVALRGTFLEKMQESLRYSEMNRARVVSEMERLRADLLNVENVRRRAIGMPPVDANSTSIRAAADVAAGQDTRVKSAVDGEQWGYRLTTMYALVELVTAEREANSIAQKQLEETRKTNELLRELIRGHNANRVLLGKIMVHTDPNNAPGPTVPHPRPST